jgi:intracellular sulfur oxidation DsrE/DsrF family protein
MKILSHIACTSLLVVATTIFPAAVLAGDFDGIKQIKVVWDITVGDEKVFTDRMGLIKETADDLRKRGLQPEFVLAIHGPAAKYVAKSLEGTKYEKDKIEKLDAIQTSMDNLKKDGMKIEVCAIAMKRAKIEDKNVQPFAVIESNVWENITVLQNKGYAYMPVF